MENYEKNIKNFKVYIKRDEKIIQFSDTKIKKHKFSQQKKAISIENR